VNSELLRRHSQLSGPSNVNDFESEFMSNLQMPCGIRPSAISSTHWKGDRNTNGAWRLGNAVDAANYSFKPAGCIDGNFKSQPINVTDKIDAFGEVALSSAIWPNHES
jgi:hypothetical protein